MAPTTFSLIELKGNVSEQSFILALKKLDKQERPAYVGKCQHWIHAPKLSKDALTGAGTTMKNWDYLIINKATSPTAFTIPDGLAASIDNSWSLTIEVPDEQLENSVSALQARRDRVASTEVPDLPAGWSPSDHSGLDASNPPPDLEASLALSSHSLGSSKEDSPLSLKEFTRTFGSKHTGPIVMFNLLSYMPGGEERYMQYIAAFQASTGIKYGGQPIFIPAGRPVWSSMKEEKDQEGGWEFAAVVWYPSIWRFAKMLDDPGYADVDRRFKQGALRDNPLICCVEVEVEYID